MLIIYFSLYKPESNKLRDAKILIISMVMVKGVKLAYYTAFPGSITAIYF